VCGNALKISLGMAEKSDPDSRMGFSIAAF
jgi:hypothetical protein